MKKYEEFASRVFKAFKGQFEYTSELESRACAVAYSLESEDPDFRKLYEKLSKKVYGLGISTEKIPEGEPIPEEVVAGISELCGDLTKRLREIKKAVKA